MNAQDEDARARGLFVKFESGKVDGMQVSVLKKVGAEKVPVEPNTEFREGDEIWVSFASNFDGYVYIVNIMPDGQKRVLFPYQTAADHQTSNLIHADEPYLLPKGDAFAFDEHAGTEILQVIMSREPIPFLDAAVKKPNGDLGDSASSAAAELQGKAAKQGYGGKVSDTGGIVTEDVAIVLPQSAAGVGSRDIRRVTVAHSSAGAKASGSPKVPASPKAPTIAKVPAGPKTSIAKGPAKAGHRVDRMGSVVAIPDDQGKSGRLKPGELAVFEIRLKHL